MVLCVSCSGGCGGGLGRRSAIPALQNTGVDHQQHGVQRGWGPPHHRDPVWESGHHSGHLAHGRTVLEADSPPVFLVFFFIFFFYFNSNLNLWGSPSLQATQKGDLVAVLRKQLEEREKQLAAQQEEAATARNRQRELTKVGLPGAVKKGK